MSETNLVLGLLSGVSLVLVGGLIRTAATKASPQAWTAGHRAALPRARRLGLFSVVCGGVLVASGFLEVADPGAVHPVTIGAFVIGYGGVLLGAISLTRAANRGAREAHPAVPRVP